MFDEKTSKLILDSAVKLSDEELKFFLEDSGNPEEVNSFDTMDDMRETMKIMFNINYDHFDEFKEQLVTYPAKYRNCLVEGMIAMKKTNMLRYIFEQYPDLELSEKVIKYIFMSTYNKDIVSLIENRKAVFEEGYKKIIESIEPIIFKEIMLDIKLLNVDKYKDGLKKCPENILIGLLYILIPVNNLEMIKYLFEFQPSLKIDSKIIDILKEAQPDIKIIDYIKSLDVEHFEKLLKAHNTKNIIDALDTSTLENIVRNVKPENEIMDIDEDIEDLKESFRIAHILMHGTFDEFKEKLAKCSYDFKVNSLTYLIPNEKIDMIKYLFETYPEVKLNKSIMPFVQNCKNKQIVDYLKSRDEKLFEQLM